jgi:hypothetical protein
MICHILPVLLILHYVVANFKSILLATHVFELFASIVFQLLIMAALRTCLAQTLWYLRRLRCLRKLQLSMPVM